MKKIISTIMMVTFLMMGCASLKPAPVQIPQNECAIVKKNTEIMREPWENRYEGYESNAQELIDTEYDQCMVGEPVDIISVAVDKKQMAAMIAGGVLFGVLGGILGGLLVQSDHVLVFNISPEYHKIKK